MPPRDYKEAVENAIYSIACGMGVKTADTRVDGTILNTT